MKVFSSPVDWTKFRKSLGGSVDIGFVPTMGALHEGHLSLVKLARGRHPLTALSIFVNPMQFGPNEDFTKYPRTLDVDLELAKHAGVDFVFAPNPETSNQLVVTTQVHEPHFSRGLCGNFRPGHFDGVATIVTKLLGLVGPRAAYFGLKDAQQYFVIAKTVRDLSIGVEIIGAPTIRANDGLALSSRNRYLGQQERSHAAELQVALTALESYLHTACKSPDPLTPNMLVEEKEALLLQLAERFGFKMQYFEMRTLPDWTPLEQTPSPKSAISNEPILLALAGSIGNTRLIDNRLLNLQELGRHGFNVLV